TCARTARTGDRGAAADPVPALRGRARLVLRAHALLFAAEAREAVEPRLLTEGRDPRPALPRARPGRPVCVRVRDGPRCRARPRDGRDVHGGHRRRQSRGRVYPRYERARLRGAHRLPVPLPRDRGIRPGRSRRARDSLERPARRRPVEHEIADPVGTGPGRVLITGAGGQLGTALAEVFPEADALTRADWNVTHPRTGF